jgi:predicted PurR-regulated permease PerM
MVKFKITKNEIRKRVGYFLLGIFTFYLFDPIKDFLNKVIPYNSIIVGILGIMLTLYFFKLD